MMHPRPVLLMMPCLQFWGRLGHLLLALPRIRDSAAEGWGWGRGKQERGCSPPVRRLSRAGWLRETRQGRQRRIDGRFQLLQLRLLMAAAVLRCRGCWGWPRAGRAWGRSSLTAYRHPCPRSWCSEHQDASRSSFVCFSDPREQTRVMPCCRIETLRALAGVSPRSVPRRPTRGAACITPYLPPNHVSPWGSKSLTCVTTPAGLTRLRTRSP